MIPYIELAGHVDYDTLQPWICSVIEEAPAAVCNESQTCWLTGA